DVCNGAFVDGGQTALRPSELEAATPHLVRDDERLPAIPVDAEECMKGFVDPSTVSTESVQVLKPDGTLVPDHGYELDLKEEDLREIYRVMILTRRVDQESTNLQRQGELGVYTPALGQEGAQVGAAYALEPHDWIFP